MTFVLNAAGELILLIIDENPSSGSPATGEASPADTELYRQALLDRPAVGDTVTYSGSQSAFSVAYNPVLLWCALGALVVLSVGCYLARKYRRKGEP